MIKNLIKIFLIILFILLFGEQATSFALCEDDKITSINENPEVSKGSFIFGVSLFFIIVIIIAGANGVDNTTVSDVLQQAAVNTLKDRVTAIGYFEPGSPSSASSMDISQIVK
jgi:hypothetical protein